MAFLKPSGNASDLEALPDSNVDVGELDEILGIFPVGRAAVSSMNSKVLTEGTLDQSVRTLVAAATAGEYSDTLQFERHLGAFASERGMSLEDARAMLTGPDWPGASPAEQALLTYVVKASNEAFKMVASDVEALSTNGWSEREIVEALTVVCVAAYMSVANLALGITEGSN